MKDNIVLERLIRESSMPGTLTYLLTEQEEEEVGGVDFSALREPVEKSIQGLSELVEAVSKKINNFEDSDFKGYMVNLLDWYSEQGQVIVKDMDNLENNMSQAMSKLGTKDAVESYNGLITQVDELMIGVHNVTHLSKAAVATLAEVVLDGMYHENESYANTPMLELLEAEQNRDPKETSKAMQKAMSTEVQDPKKEQGGFLGKVKSFFKMGGSDIQVGPLGDKSKSVDELVEMAMQMTPLQVGRAAEALMDMVKTEEQMQAKIEDIKDEAVEELEGAVEQAEEVEESTDGEAPEDDLSPEEAADEAEEELRDAALEVAKAGEDPPAVAIAKALDAWAAGLSPTSQKSLQQKNRLVGLKDLVDTSLASAAKAVEGEVEKAVQQWRGEHEETLIKSKRFAKKNFDSLQDLIPKIAGALMKKTNESNRGLTSESIKKSVYKYLNKKFKSDNVLIESNRWQKIAGLK